MSEKKYREFWVRKGSFCWMIEAGSTIKSEVSSKYHLIEYSALEAEQAKVAKLKEILVEEFGECEECLDAKLEGYTICGDCSC